MSLCQHCGELIRDRRPMARYCSDDCSYRAWRKRWRKRKTKRKQASRPTKFVECPICERRVPRRHHTQIYCDDYCFEFHKKHGDRWPSWISQRLIYRRAEAIRQRRSGVAEHVPTFQQNREFREDLAALVAQGESVPELARQFGVSQRLVYKARAEQNERVS